jgi:hypothetical protein
VIFFAAGETACRAAAGILIRAGPTRGAPLLPGKPFRPFDGPDQILTGPIWSNDKHRPSDDPLQGWTELER